MGYSTLTRPLVNWTIISLIQINHGEELAIIQMANKDFERASHYHRLCTDRLLYDWSTLDELMSDARVHNLQSLQVCCSTLKWLLMVLNHYLCHNVSNVWISAENCVVVEMTCSSASHSQWFTANRTKWLLVNHWFAQFKWILSGSTLYLKSQ